MLRATIKCVNIVNVFAHENLFVLLNSICLPHQTSVIRSPSACHYLTVAALPLFNCVRVFESATFPCRALACSIVSANAVTTALSVSVAFLCTYTHRHKIHQSHLHILQYIAEDLLFVQQIFSVLCVSLFIQMHALLLLFTSSIKN